MATVIERVSSRSTGRDRLNKRIGTQIFIVDLPPNTVMQTPPAGLPIPAFSTFPGDTSLICDNIVADWEPGSVGYSEVRATFTNDRSGTFGGSSPVDPTDPAYRSWSVDFRVVNQNMPYAVRNPFRYAWTNTATTPPTESYITGYEIEQFNYREVHEIIVRRTVVTAFETAQYENIGGQVNTLHKIGDRWYLYSSGSVEELTPGRWKVEHIWQYDPGTPNDFRVSTADLIFPEDQVSQIPGVLPGVLYARPPYHGIVPVPGLYDPGPPPLIGPPSFRAVPEYAVVNLNGWQSLPGMP